jgi:hypothetical protein
MGGENHLAGVGDGRHSLFAGRWYLERICFLVTPSAG